MDQHNLIIDLLPMRYPYTGTYFYCQYLIQALQKCDINKSINTTLFTPAGIENDFSDYFRIYKINKLFKYFIPGKEQFHLWHTTIQNSKYFPYSYQGKLLFTIHDLNFLYENIPEEKKQKCLKEIQRRIDKADKIVAISHFVKEDILRNCNVSPSKIEVIYNGCILEENPVMTPPKYRPGHSFFFTLGMVEDKKNFKVLPAMLLQNDYQLLIAGKTPDAPYCNAIMEEAQRLGVADRVKILGPISDGERNWYISHCRLLPFPSKAEGFGLPVIEAMHFGKPVLVSRFTSLPEIGGEEAYYFEQYDSNAVAHATTEALKDFDNDPGKAQRLKERAALFTWEKTARQYMAVYKALLEEA